MNSNSANDKYGSSLDRTLGAGKPVDPATRLSELLAQSLEELTRPFDAPRTGPHPARPNPDPAAAQPLSPEAAAHDLLPREEAPPEPTAEESRIDADKALAELEAELFAAAKQVDNDTTIAHHEDVEKTAEDGADHPESAPAEAADAAAVTAHSDGDEVTRENEAASLATLVPSAASEPEAAPVADAAAANLIARVKRLMLVSMAITVIAVGSVFGFIGYRIFKGEGTTAKIADKLPPSSPVPNEISLSLPRGARVLQAAVANDRLLITLEVDGKPEVRTFDVKTLQPTGRLSFTGTP